MTIEYFNTCIICDSADIKDMSGYEEAFLCKCSKCSFVFSKRIPTLEELIKHYEGYGRNDFLSDITIKRYHELLDEFEKVRKTNRILDIGCGIGYFLEVAKKRGWEVYGTEFTAKAIEICEEKGIKMHQGALNPENYPTDFFDIITSFEVIEHINTPQIEIKNIHKILRKEGYFYVTTPNFNSLLRYHLKGKYNVIGWPEHLSYYTPKTINFLLTNNGFKKKWIKTTGFSLTRLSTSKQEEIPYTNQAFIAENTKDEQLRRSFEENPILGFVKKSANTTLSVIGKGDALKALYIKNK
jgi:2-polyprenyl-3-methyl-5-hydroxy-6-metoxy-1,4-benzoquinol methylase